MKKLLLIPILLFAFSCKKESNQKQNSTASLLVAKWQIQKDSDNFFYTNSSLNYHSIENYDSSYYLIFNSDGTGNNSGQFNFTYKVNNNTLTFYDQAYISGGLNFPADTTIVAIQKLTAHNLNIYFDFLVNEPGVDLTENNVYEYLTR